MGGIMSSTTKRQNGSQVSLLSLPNDLLVKIFSACQPDDIPNVLCVNKSVAGLQNDLWRGVVERNWPVDAAKVSNPTIDWRFYHNYFVKRDGCAKLKPYAESCKIVTNFRRILIGWLLEVSADPASEELRDSVTLHQAARFLDCCLAALELPHHTWYQLAAAGCIYVAQQEAKATSLCLTVELEKDGSLKLCESSCVVERGQDSLAESLVDLCNSTYSSEDILDMASYVKWTVNTGDLDRFNARTFLRYFWFILHQWSSTLGNEEDEPLYVYKLAGFCVNLSLLDEKCCCMAPPLVAAAGLAIALEFFGYEDWSEWVQRVSLYCLDELDEPFTRMKVLLCEPPEQVFRYCKLCAEEILSASEFFVKYRVEYKALETIFGGKGMFAAQ